MFFEPTQKGISNALGATSVTCWLFAQFPQVIENYRLGSCKGLALPFLVNWLLGDFTNLIGCIFTDQLPFQTYLATWFCIIDFTLIAQYFYYTRKERQHLRQGGRHHHSHHHHHQHPTHHHSHSSQPHSQRHSVHITGSSQHLQHNAEHASTRTSKPGSAPVAGPTGRQNGPSASRSNTMTSSMVVTSGNAPATISRTHSMSRAPDQKRSPAPGRPVTLQQNRRAGRTNSTGNQLSDQSDAEESETIPPAMYESVQSRRSDLSTSTLGSLRRGRPYARSQQAPAQSAPEQMSEALQWDGQHRQASGSRHRQSTTDARDSSVPSRVRSVVFLSIWTFCGLAGILRRSVVASSTHAEAWAQASVSVIGVAEASGQRLEKLSEDLPLPSMDYSLVIGRISAWICVCFYLTSRMPQIWKNFQRRSVEGLSILLFAAAFAGNSFYVMSVLTSPLIKEDDGYLFESIPFLLGSGGTLAFDLTIMGQACLYRGLSPQGYEKERRLYDDEEGASLLASQEQMYISGGTEPRGSQCVNVRRSAVSDALQQ